MQPSTLLRRSGLVLRLSPLLSLVVVFLVSFVSGLSSDMMQPQGASRSSKAEATFGSSDMMHTSTSAAPMMGGKMGAPMMARAMHMEGGVGSAPNAHYDADGGGGFASSSSYGDVGADIASSLRGEDGKTSFDASGVERMLVWTGNVNFAVTEGTGAYDKISLEISAIRDRDKQGDLTGSYVENESERTNVNFIYPECVDSRGNWHNCRDYHRLSPAAKASFPIDPTKPVQVPVRSRSLTLRVPTPSFPGVFSSLVALPSLLAPSSSRVSDSSSSAHDVTSDYVDVASRELTLSRTQNALEKLMSSASSTSDVMNIMRELKHVTTEIESARQRMKYLKKASNLSTLHLNINEETSAAPVVVFPDEPGAPTNDKKGWDPRKTLEKAVGLFGHVLTQAADSAIFTAVIGGPLAGVLFVGVKLLGKRGQGWGALP